MITQKIEQLANEAIAENNTLFLISLQHSANGTVKILVDGEQGVSIKECIRISRHIEHNLEETEIENIGLEVSTPDIAKPLQVNKQYLKNLGKTLLVKTNSGNFEGELTAITENHIELKWEAREPKTIGKGKITVTKKQSILLNDILEAKVKLAF